MTKKINSKIVKELVEMAYQCETNREGYKIFKEIQHDIVMAVFENKFSSQHDVWHLGRCYDGMQALYEKWIEEGRIDY